MNLADFNEQNGVWSLTVEGDSDRNRLVISPTYGLTGGFTFSEAVVLIVQQL
jgi:hypothetical protein